MLRGPLPRVCASQRVVFTEEVSYRPPGRESPGLRAPGCTDSGPHAHRACCPSCRVCRLAQPRTVPWPPSQLRDVHHDHPHPKEEETRCL